MALFSLENLMISATFGVDPQSTRTFHPVLDTGTGQSLIHKDALPNVVLPPTDPGAGVGGRAGALDAALRRSRQRMGGGLPAVVGRYMVAPGVRLHVGRGAGQAPPGGRLATAARWRGGAVPGVPPRGGGRHAADTLLATRGGHGWGGRHVRGQAGLEV